MRQVAWLWLVLLAGTPPAYAADFVLTSPDIKPGGTISRRFEHNAFGCSGENKSPALRWTGAPAGTQAFAVTVYDLDAPSGTGWWHWSVINIPATVTELAPNAGASGGAALPKGAAHLTTSFGTDAWGGTCPPKGSKPHRYVFTVYALKSASVAVRSRSSAADAESVLANGSLGSASFTASYARSK